MSVEMSYCLLKLLATPLLCHRPLSTKPLTVITVPVHLQGRIKKVRAKHKRLEEENRLAHVRMGNRDVPVITCKKPELNHYKGQSYGKFDMMNLASRGWCGRKSAGDYFTINSFNENPTHSESSQSHCTFTEFGLRKELLKNLDDMQVQIPTSIQSLAIPKLLKGTNAICAAETGSGKTLAYLLPLINNILEYQEVINRKDVYCSPLALILVPGRELAVQIENVITRLTQMLPLKSQVLIGGLGTQKMMRDPPVENVDIVVASLGVFKKLVSSEIYDIKSVRNIVIDEADTMLDDSFNEILTGFLRKFKIRDTIPSNPLDPNVGVQLCFVGATLPRSMDAILNEVVVTESLMKIATPHLHRLMPHVPQKFLKLKKSHKPARLLEIVKSDIKKHKAIMVFSKDAATCNFVKLFLEENGVKANNLNGAMPAKLRCTMFQEFQDGNCNVLSCTDVGSRGLDTIKVQHVINYDFPSFMSDYIHRAGRVGRVGSSSPGHVTNFISTPYEADLVQKIEMAARKAVILPNVNANITRKLSGLLTGDDYL